MQTDVIVKDVQNEDAPDADIPDKDAPDRVASDKDAPAIPVNVVASDKDAPDIPVNVERLKKNEASLEDDVRSRWMLESSIARAHHERMIQARKLPLDLSAPKWHAEAKKYGGSSMSIAGFNMGYGTPRDSLAGRAKYGGKDLLERNYLEAMQAWEYFHQPWPVTPESERKGASNPVTGWVSWDVAAEDFFEDENSSTINTVQTAPGAGPRMYSDPRTQTVPSHDGYNSGGLIVKNSPAVERILDVAGMTPSSPSRSKYTMETGTVEVEAQSMLSEAKAKASLPECFRAHVVADALIKEGGQIEKLRLQAETMPEAP
jgi:hypothetical protein